MTDYWEEMYGKRSKDFIDGVIAGVETFAVWENGIQVVGIMKRQLKNEIADIKKEMGYPGESGK